MVWLHDKDLWLGFPDLFDGLVWRFEAKCLELLGEVIGNQPVPDMSAQLVDRGIVEGFDDRFLDGANHAFGLTVGPGMIGFGKPMLDAVFPAYASENMRKGQACAPFGLGELDPVVGQYGVDCVGHGSDQRLEKAGRDHFHGPAVEAGKNQFGGAINSDIEAGLPVFVVQFRDVDVKVTDLIGLCGCRP